ncbi:MAG: bacteriohopanetetrol glucosamine biosynthesis glycosyltransferase HpnI [Bryobacteraceae bacterium]
MASLFASGAAGTVLAAVLALVLLGSLVFTLLSILAAQRYLSVPARMPVGVEPISILKPLAGLDEGLEANVRTFFEQEYAGDYEILFAVRRADDPAAAVVRELQKEYGGVPSRLLIVGEPPYPNAKVWSLDHMMREAAYDLLVMSDSDIRVTPTLLTTVAAEFEDPHIGVATCPYRAVPGSGIWSKLEATGMNTDFIAGILTARMLEGMKFAVGPTIVARKTVLEDIGGWDRVREYLAEDFVIGQFADQKGHGVMLSSYVIEHHIGTSTFAGNASHRIRWTRSTRRSRPAGYVGQLFTMPIPIALLLTAVRPEFWPALACAAIFRYSAAWVMSALVLRGSLAWHLVPLEDLMTFAFWIGGFFGNTIVWRGRVYRLLKDGRFELKR